MSMFRFSFFAALLAFFRRPVLVHSTTASVRHPSQSAMIESMEARRLLSASVTSSLSDANLNNNTASSTTAVAEPAIVVAAPVTITGKNQNNVMVATFTHASGVWFPMRRKQ